MTPRFSLLLLLLLPLTSPLQVTQLGLHISSLKDREPAATQNTGSVLSHTLMTPLLLLFLSHHLLLLKAQRGLHLSSLGDREPNASALNTGPLQGYKSSSTPRPSIFQTLLTLLFPSIIKKPTVPLNNAPPRPPLIHPPNPAVLLNNECIMDLPPQDLDDRLQPYMGTSNVTHRPRDTSHLWRGLWIDRNSQTEIIRPN